MEKKENISKALVAESENVAEIKMPDPATEPGNYVIVVEHPGGGQETYVVVNGTVKIGLYDQGSFPVR